MSWQFDILISLLIILCAVMALAVKDLISAIIKESKINVGTCQLFVHNSFSSLLITDTADEDTKEQTIDFLAQLAPSRTRIYRNLAHVQVNHNPHHACQWFGEAIR